MAATAQGKPETMENNPLPPDAKVWILRVSIHCEGCKKKVIKIMNKIKGVYRTEVDMSQHKVTVVGNVEVGTLIRSLEKKKGRNWKVELWPQPAPTEKKQSRSKNREEPPKQQEQEQSKEAPNNGDNKPKAAAQEKTQLGPQTEAETSSKKSENGGGSKDGGETSENGVNGKETAGEDAKTAEAKKGEIGPAGIQPAAAEKSSTTAAAVEKSENGGGGEDKKGQNGNNTNSDSVEEGGGERSNGSSGSMEPSQAGSSQVRVHNEYSGSFPNRPPPHYYMPPAYTVSYHSTVSDYGASYYGPPPPGSSYAYMHPGQDIEAYNPPYPYVNESADHVFERFSDENPNACSVM